MRKFSILFLIISLLFSACKNENEIFINYKHPEINYQGRIDTSSINAAELFWSGSSVKINFEGESIKALLKDETGDNYYNVIIDDKDITILNPDTIKKPYVLATNLSKGKHSIEIFKRTEFTRGKTIFYGFQIGENDKILEKSPERKRKIEFYGNSITAGYAIEDLSGRDSPDSIYTNNYLSYALLTAKHFDADYHCICKSGIGITISWSPQIMPEIYDRLNPSDAFNKWDFSLYQADIVVINLFQNDSWLVNRPEREEFKQNFGKTPPSEEYIINAYQEFISNIRTHYPNTHIICMLGTMDATREGSIWPSYIEKAVENLNDQKIFTHFIPYKETPGHPSAKVHEEMAESLIQFIETTVPW